MSEIPQEIQAQLDSHREALFDCYRISGADVSGIDGWQHGVWGPPDAVQAVTVLREDYDEACEEVDPRSFAAGFEEGIKKARELVEETKTDSWGPDFIQGVEFALAALVSGLSDSQKQVECTCSGTDMCLRCNPDPPVEDGASAPAVTTDEGGKSNG